MSIDHITLTLRDPSARAAFCGFDSTYSAIPGCRAFSVVELYDNESGDSDAIDGVDGVEAAASDTAGTGSGVTDNLGAGSESDSLAGAGKRRFVVLAAQVGVWELEGRVPAHAGYIAADLWLDVRVVPNRGAPHVASIHWAELKPGGWVRSKLQVGRDGSVVLVGTVTSGAYSREPAKGGKL